MKRIALGVLIALFLAAGCGKSKKEEPVVARWQDREVTLHEFRLFYELDPMFGIDSSGYPALLDEMNKYLTRAAAFEQLQAEGLTADSNFQKLVNWETQQAMLRQLYREVVGKQIKISDEEMRQEFRRLNRMVHVRHLFSKDSAQVRQWRKELEKGADFAELARKAFTDTVLSKNGGDLGWIKLGDLDDDFAAAVEKLKPGQLSDLVATRWGYHLVELLDAKPVTMITEDAYLSQKRKIERKLRQKKSAWLSAEYIANYLGKLNPQPSPSGLKLLWTAIITREEGKPALHYPYILNDRSIQLVYKRLAEQVNEPLVKFKGGEITIGEYLQALKQMPVGHRPRFKTPKEMADKLAVWIRDRFLQEEAQRRGLQKHPRVLADVREVKEEQAYYYYLQAEIKEIQVPPEIEAFYKQKKSEVALKYPELARYHTLQEWIWWKAERQMLNRFKDALQTAELDTTLLQKESRQVDWQGRIRMFAVRKPAQ
ncbi:MAG: hypothetical protein Kow0037_12920 [Calditrichia bacterium]